MIDEQLAWVETSPSMVCAVVGQLPLRMLGLLTPLVNLDPPAGSVERVEGWWVELA